MHQIHTHKVCFSDIDVAFLAKTSIDYAHIVHEVGQKGNDYGNNTASQMSRVILLSAYFSGR